MRARRCRVHRIQPRVRDDRDTPLIRDRMARAGSRDLPDGEREIFLRGGLDGANHVGIAVINRLPRSPYDWTLGSPDLPRVLRRCSVWSGAALPNG
jgi:hypothetical protein